ncbi:hypothetical protein H9L19_04775 [Weissella diestrammenae]|uniref:Uncharacterized protein n=1 Tax=Weissella diestrammenae TaxID=1162633 RepID=A0A7G9T3R3_9LACO|nr:hypothetical protein [Weissella diestrammenae]MCM0582720.1 hypothetical protein [Weissella diestrammenae]QNN74738.1 hypothetical protein H9L19_04775 [Weissella diestrammenae]
MFLGINEENLEVRLSREGISKLKHSMELLKDASNELKNVRDELEGPAGIETVDIVSFDMLQDYYKMQNLLSSLKETD